MLNETQPVSAHDAPRRERTNTPESGFQGIFSALAGSHQMFTMQANNNIAAGWTQSNSHNLANAPQETRLPQNQQDNRIEWHTRGDARQPSSKRSEDRNGNFQLNGNAPVREKPQAKKNAQDISQAEDTRLQTDSSSQPDQTTDDTEVSESWSSSEQNAVDNNSQTVNSTDDSDKIAQKLKDLGLNEEQVKEVMTLINNETQAGLKELLKNLSELQNPAHVAQDLSQDIASRQQFLSQLSTQENSIRNLLAQAGLSQTDAKNLLDKIKTDVENSLQVREVLNNNTRSSEITKLSQAETAAVLTTNTSDKLVANLATNKSDGNSMDVLSRFGLATKSDHVSDAKNKAGDTSLFSKKNSEATMETPDRLLNMVSTQITNTQNPDTIGNAVQQNLQNVSDLVVKTPETVQATQDTPVQNIASVTDMSSKTIHEARPVAPQELSAARDIGKPIVNQIIEKFSLRGNGQQNEINIRLDPPDLGTVRINITSSGESVKTTLIAENHAVKQAIENNLNHLRDAMADQGLTVESFTVLVGGNPGQKGQNQQQNGMNPVGVQLPENSTEKTPGAPSSPRQHFYGESQSISVFA